MIEKLLVLKNIGIFDEYRVDRDTWDKSFKKNNLIYAENGQGKTTLSIVLESLSKNSSDMLIGRKTLGSTGEQKIEFMSGSTKITFENGTWSQRFPDIEIFNSRFVNENLYMGDTVNVEQKRNLQSFVLGDEGVQLINKINNYDDEIKGIQSEIKACEKALQTHASSMKVESFIGLPKIEDIDAQIKQVESTIRSLEQSEEISKHSELENIVIQLPNADDLKQLLSKTYEDISKDAELLVSQHIVALNDNYAESWVNKGLKLMSDSKCPFCANEISNNSLIQAYKQYFNQKYEEYKTQLHSSIDEIKRDFSEINLLKLQKLVSDNTKEVEYWNTKVDSQLALYFSTEMFSLLESLSKLLDSIFESKKNDILQSIELPEEVYRILEQVGSEVAVCQKGVLNTNIVINEFKQRVSATNKQEMIDKLAKLRLTKTRYLEEVDKVCKEYLDYAEKKKRVEKSKSDVRTELDRYMDRFKMDFCEDVNSLLSIFGAGFSICEIDTDFRSGPKFEYKLCINGQAFCLTDFKSRETVPQFKNTLSEGDKTTLAFAFFIVKVKKLPNVANTIVVIDDPISSLDFFRLNMTAGIIYELSKNVKQMFILTHDLKFAKKCFDRMHYSNTLLMLEIYRKRFRRFQIDKAHLSDYFRNYFILDDYINGQSEESELSVVRAIRPLMEGHLRMHYPKHFTCEKWLGDFIDMLREATPAAPYFCIKDKLSDIENINEYSKQYHHEGTDSYAINSTELKAFAIETLKFCS